MLHQHLRHVHVVIHYVRAHDGRGHGYGHGDGDGGGRGGRRRAHDRGDDGDGVLHALRLSKLSRQVQVPVHWL